MIHEAREWLLTTSRDKREELIGATITLLALLTASATLAGHRAHTEEVVFQTKATDQWGFYQAKHIRAHMYGMEAEKALASSDAGMHKLARKYLTTAIYEQCGAPAAKSARRRAITATAAPTLDWKDLSPRSAGAPSSRGFGLGSPPRVSTRWTIILAAASSFGAVYRAAVPMNSG